MENEIQAVTAGELSKLPDAHQNIHTGSGDIYSNIGAVYQITNYPGTEQYYPDEIDHRYYNLFVVICRLPSIFATRNRNGRSTNDDHTAMYGFIKSMSIQGDLLVIKHSMNREIVQQELNKIEDALQFEYAPDSNELDKVHWTIKEVNLRKIIGL